MINKNEPYSLFFSGSILNELTIKKLTEFCFIPQVPLTGDLRDSIYVPCFHTLTGSVGSYIIGAKLYVDRWPTEKEVNARWKDPGLGKEKGVKKALLSLLIDTKSWAYTLQIHYPKKARSKQ